MLFFEAGRSFVKRWGCGIVGAVRSATTSTILSVRGRQRPTSSSPEDSRRVRIYFLQKRFQVRIASDVLVRMPTIIAVTPFEFPMGAILMVDASCDGRLRCLRFILPIRTTFEQRKCSATSSKHHPYLVADMGGDALFTVFLQQFRGAPKFELRNLQGRRGSKVMPFT